MKALVCFGGHSWEISATKSSWENIHIHYIHSLFIPRKHYSGWAQGNYTSGQSMFADAADKWCSYRQCWESSRGTHTHFLKLKVIQGYWGWAGSQCDSIFDSWWLQCAVMLSCMLKITSVKQFGCTSVATIKPPASHAKQVRLIDEQLYSCCKLAWTYCKSSVHFWMRHSQDRQVTDGPLWTSKIALQILLTLENNHYIYIIFIPLERRTTIIWKCSKVEKHKTQYG